MADDFQITLCWQNVSDDLRARVLDFWQAQNALGEGDAAPRLVALCAVAEAGGQIIATATSLKFYWEETRTNYFLFRCFVAPAWRQKGVATKLFNKAYQHLHEWADTHPDEDVHAMLAAPAGAQQLAGKLSEKVWKNTGLRLTGFSQQGTPLYARWFLQTIPEANLPEDLETRVLWKNVSQADRDAIVAMWAEHDALPTDVDPQERANQAVVAAFHKGKAVGVYSAAEGVVERMRAKVLYVRAFIAPEYRRHLLGARLNDIGQHHIRRWALDHPEAGIDGVAMVVQFDFKIGRAHFRPISEHTTFRVGYTPEDRPVRMNWFVEGDAPNGGGD